MDGTFSAFDTEASLCVWEWLIDQWNDQSKGNGTDTSDINDTTIKGLFENHGWSAMRSVAMQAGKIVAELYDHCETHSGFEHLTETSLDWEFVPMICAEMDWEKLADDNQYGKATWAPDPKELIAIIIAKQALHRVPA